MDLEAELGLAHGALGRTGNLTRESTQRKGKGPGREKGGLPLWSEAGPLRALWEKASNSLSKELAWASQEKMAKLQKSQKSQTQQSQGHSAQALPSQGLYPYEGGNKDREGPNMANTCSLSYYPHPTNQGRAKVQETELGTDGGETHT